MSAMGSPGMATISASLPGASTPRSPRPSSSAAMLVPAFKARAGTQPGLSHCLELEHAMAEREHAAIGTVRDLDLTAGQQPLRCEDLLVIAPEFPHRLARESAGLQSVQIFLGH